MDEQLPYLQTFVKVADSNSFTAAANELGLTQAAISQRIQVLETRLNTVLFERGKGGRISITASGQSLYEFAQQILDLNRQAISSITGKRAAAVGELLLSCSSVPGQYILPELLTPFRQKFPDIRVRASITDSQTVLDKMERGKTHLGIVGMRVEHPTLRFEAFAKDDMAVLVPPDHELVGTGNSPKSVSVNRLLDYPFVVREPGSGSRRCLEEALQQQGFSLNDLNVALELGNNEAIKQAVLQGVGITALSCRCAAEELATGKLVAIKAKKLNLSRVIYFVTASKRVLPQMAQQFRSFAMERSG